MANSRIAHSPPGEKIRINLIRLAELLYKTCGSSFQNTNKQLSIYNSVSRKQTSILTRARLFTIFRYNFIIHIYIFYFLKFTRYNPRSYFSVQPKSQKGRNTLSTTARQLQRCHSSPEKTQYHLPKFLLSYSNHL